MKVEEKLINGASANSAKGFLYPDQYETMSVGRAFSYLDLWRYDHHGYVFDDYYDFLKLLVKKCGIDIDYVFGPDFEEDIEKIEKHQIYINLDGKEKEKLFEQVDQKVKEIKLAREQKYRKQEAVEDAVNRYFSQSFFRRARYKLQGKSPKHLDDFSTDEIKELYQGKKKK